MTNFEGAGKQIYFQIIFIGFALLNILGGCSYEPEIFQQEKLVVTTTGMLGDAVREILPEKYTVYHLMGSGIDPHSYEAKPSDIKELAKRRRAA